MCGNGKENHLAQRSANSVGQRHTSQLSLLGRRVRLANTRREPMRRNAARCRQMQRVRTNAVARHSMDVSQLHAIGPEFGHWRQLVLQVLS